MPGTEIVQQHSMLENILNAMDSYIYVSDLQTDEILFVNRKMAADFKLDEDAKGDKCWRRLRSGRDGRCPWCAKRKLEKNPDAPVTWEEDNIIVGKSLLKIERLIDWPDGRKVHLQQCLDITEMKEARETLQRREQMLDTLNKAAILLLSRKDEAFEAAMTEGVSLISGIGHFDRMSVFRNLQKPDGLHISQIYRWSKESGGTTETLSSLTDTTYTALFPRWEGILASGECINGPVCLMPENEKIKHFGCVSILAIPILRNNLFWGFVLFENRLEERSFTSHEADMLRSASFMLANVVDRHEEMKRIHETDEYAKLLLDATPLASRLWDKDDHLIQCNEAAVKLFGLKNKQEYLDRYFELAPEYQPDGSKTSDKAKMMVREAFEKGTCRYHYEYKAQDGSPMPAEVTMVRVPFGDDFVVAAYSRDLREHNQMMAEIETRDQQLTAALADAEEANHAKSNFLAHMSHEIRTPLNAVVGLSELALNEEELDSEMTDKLEKIHTSGLTILSIVNDILDISKIESGKFEMYPAEYDTPSLINDIVTLNIVRIGEKPINFRLHVDENLPGTLYGDDLRVKQIFNNLLSNAFKYTNTGTIQWRLDFEQSENEVWLISSIQDTGIGIKPEGLQKLFSDYNQVDAETNRKVEGTGLGLAITKRLVDMMGGSIRVESEYGKGTTFYVRLRQTYVPGKPIGKDVAENLMGLRYTLAKRSNNTKRSRSDLSYARILVVDDIITNLDVVKGMMKPYKAEIDCATSGRQAIEMIQAEKPRYHAIFMDHMMPEMDGIEAVRIIREEIGTDYARRIPIIALTANAIVGNEEMFLRKGFQDFISKPIDMSKLDAVLRQWVKDTAVQSGTPVTSSGAGPVGIVQGGQGLAAAQPANESAGLRPGVQGFTARLEGSAGSQLGQTRISGIDQDKALARFSGDEEVLLEVLHSYADETRTIVDKLDGYLAQENLTDYAIAVHGVKGSSYSIFAMQTGQLAEVLERAAKAGRLEEVRAGHGAFCQTAKALVTDIDSAFSRMTLGGFQVQAKKKILLAVPSGAMLRSIKGRLGESYEVLPANSASMALKCLSMNRADLILLDEAITSDDGKPALEVIRSAPESADIPVILLTGEEGKDPAWIVQAVTDCFAAGTS